MLALKVLSVRVSGGRAALDLMVYIVLRRFYLIFILQGFVLVFMVLNVFTSFSMLLTVLIMFVMAFVLFQVFSCWS